MTQSTLCLSTHPRAQFAFFWSKWWCLKTMCTDYNGNACTSVAQDRISFQYARTNAHDARLIYHFSPRSLLPLAQLRTITAHVFFTFVCPKYQNTTASSSDRQHYITLHHPVSGGEGGKSSQLQVAAPTRRAWPSSKDSATCDAKGQSVPWRAFDGNVQKPFLRQHEESKQARRKAASACEAPQLSATAM